MRFVARPALSGLSHASERAREGARNGVPAWCAVRSDLHVLSQKRQYCLKWDSLSATRGFLAQLKQRLLGRLSGPVRAFRGPPYGHRGVGQHGCHSALRKRVRASERRVGRIEDVRKFIVDFGLPAASSFRGARVGETVLPSTAASDTVAEMGQGRVYAWRWQIALAAAVGTIGIFHHAVPQTSVHWVYILQRAYYVPIVLAGLKWGWRGGMGFALLSGAAFAIGQPPIWSVRAVEVMDQCLEIGVFCLVGLTAGVLTDKQRKQQRALQITTDQLRRAHQELQENFESMKRADRLSALGQLSAGLAHEIRNPLASIEGAVTVLQRESPSEERRLEFLDIIHKESRRLNRLLNSFLNFAKPREPDLQEVEIDDLLESVISLARHADGSGRLELRKEIHSGTSRLKCDPEQMKQVFLNLVMNAAQAMPRGGTVVLAARREKGRILIDVEDEGPGISRDEVERVFDPFFTTKDAGTGLGLSVAHQIVRQHGGGLTITRNSPAGATFRVSLPLDN